MLNSEGIFVLLESGPGTLQVQNNWFRLCWINEWVLRGLVDPIAASMWCQWHGFGVDRPEFECSLFYFPAVTLASLFLLFQEPISWSVHWGSSLGAAERISRRMVSKLSVNQSPLQMYLEKYLFPQHPSMEISGSDPAGWTHFWVGPWRPGLQSSCLLPFLTLLRLRCLINSGTGRISWYPEWLGYVVTNLNILDVIPESGRLCLAGGRKVGRFSSGMCCSCFGSCLLALWARVLKHGHVHAAPFSSTVVHTELPPPLSPN